MYYRRSLIVIDYYLLMDLDIDIVTMVVYRLGVAYWSVYQTLDSTIYGSISIACHSQESLTTRQHIYHAIGTHVAYEKPDL